MSAMGVIVRYVLIGSLFSTLFACSKQPKPASEQVNELSSKRIAEGLASDDPRIRTTSIEQAMRMAPDLRKSLFAEPLAILMRSKDRATRINAVRAALELSISDAIRPSILDALTTARLTPEELRPIPWSYRAILSSILRTSGDPEIARLGFIYPILGRWKEFGVRKGYETRMSAPTGETDWVISPDGMVIETRPEFKPPSSSDLFSFDSFRKVSDDLFDLNVDGDVKRFKVPMNEKSNLEVTSVAEVEKETTPSVRELMIVTPDWGSAPQPK